MDDELHRDAPPATHPTRPVAARALGRARPLAIGISLTAAAAVLVAAALATPAAEPTPHGSEGGPPPTGPGPSAVGAVPPRTTLAAYSGCAAMLDGLRVRTAAQVTADGVALGRGRPVLDNGMATMPAGSMAAAGASAPGGSAPTHSTTNDQEIGIDEPDLVKTDGRRIVAISDGVLRVIDAATRRITGSLDLSMYAGAQGAQLMLAGHRVLVLLGSNVVSDRPSLGVSLDPPGTPASGGSTFLLIDIASTPTVVSTLRSNGGYVDARLIGGAVRVVVASSPRLAFPRPTGNESIKERVAANRRVIERAPLRAWLPTYLTTRDGVTTRHAVPCDRVSHPARYTGESMLTVYSFDLGATLDHPEPISVAADGATVYADAAGLYVSSSNGRNTQVHRFAVSGAGAPRYVGSGAVPGQLLDSYSMSAYRGHLRVVTTQYFPDRSTSVYVLDAGTLRRTGSVGGLGAGENLHAVRFLGPLAYLVTFRAVDPLYVLDLHDPAHPRRAGELKVPGYSDYLHPAGDGRLLGVGQTVDAQQRVSGLQVALFDVTDATHPTRIARLTRTRAPSETPIDPHAFLYWPATRTAVLPIDSWDPNLSGAAMVLHVGRDGLRAVGTIRNPATSTISGYDTGIARAMIIGDTIWTMSSSGLRASDLQSLARQAWVPFS